MKNLLFVLSTSFLILFSCSSESDNHNNTKSSIIGKWKLISKIENYDGSSVEAATPCQLVHFQMEFKNNGQLLFTQVSDDPQLTLDQCNPEIFNYTYSLNGNKLTLTDQDNTSTATILKQLSYSTLKFALYETNQIDFMIWTLSRIEN